jgi:LysR family transcriptional regulator, regulator for bpeEF and oprC
VIDLNDLRAFEKVAAAKSFSEAARALGLPRSSLSRSVARLEEELGARLFQRTTREVALTPAGAALQLRCGGLLAELEDAVGEVRSATSVPRGHLRVTSFAANLLRKELPAFLLRYPEITVAIDVSSEVKDLLAEADVAIRLGPMPNSGVVTTRLRSMKRYLCASPSYIDRRGMPESPDDLAGRETIDMPGGDGRPRCWTFTRAGETKRLEIPPRASVNDEGSIKSLLVDGAGIGIVGAYCAGQALVSGQLVRLLPEWSIPPLDVNIVFPSKRGLSPNVRVFVDFIKERLGAPTYDDQPEASSVG